MDKQRRRAAIWMGGALAATCALTCPAFASQGYLTDIQICNEYADAIYVALAYAQTDGAWVSRGWLSVPTGDCSYFDTALRVPIFYYRAETEWHALRRRGRSREVWGGDGDRSFAVVENANGSFNYYRAEEHFSGIPNEPFTKFFHDTELTLEGDSTATLTFKADGSVSAGISPVDAPSTPPSAPSPDGRSTK